MTFSLLSTDGSVAALHPMLPWSGRHLRRGYWPCRQRCRRKVRHDLVAEIADALQIIGEAQHHAVDVGFLGDAIELFGHPLVRAVDDRHAHERDVAVRRRAGQPARLSRVPGAGLSPRSQGSPVSRWKAAHAGVMVGGGRRTMARKAGRGRPPGLPARGSGWKGCSTRCRPAASSCAARAVNMPLRWMR